MQYFMTSIARTYKIRFVPLNDLQFIYTNLKKV